MPIKPFQILTSTLSNSKSIAISTSSSHLLDHLGVLSAELSIPLVVTDSAAYLSGKKYYPNLDLIYMDIGEITPHFLAQYDFIIESDRYWALELSALLDLLFEKRPTFIYCPHGNSDKGYSLTSVIPQDIHLIYGNQMYDQLKNKSSFEKILHIFSLGNFRKKYYEQHQLFYDELTEKEIFSNYKEKKTILYAPTWHSQETPSSFFNGCTQLVEEIPTSYQLIIKLHPFLEEHYPSQVYSLINRFTNHPHLLFLDHFPPIYPLLARTDIYIGDFSSIGYDFLAFDRPLYFFNPGAKAEEHPSRFLHQCGLTLPSKKIFDFIKETLEENQKAYSAIRHHIYHYVFGGSTLTERSSSK